MQRLSSSRSFLALLALALVAFVVSTAASRTALAADPRVEKEAKDLRTKAIEEDSLGLQWQAAIDKLNAALQKCGADKCGNPLKAQLYQDVGVMQLNNKEKDKAIQSFVQALKVDPSFPLAKEHKSAEIEEAWETAKKSAGGATSNEGPPQGDFEHTAAPEQQANTPLPIYVKYTGKEKLVKVVVRYKGSQMGGLESAELAKMGDGWGGLIPCKDVTEGQLQYYVRGENEGGDKFTLGDPNHMFKVAIKNGKVENPPSLPGATPPKQCSCPPDAPPDFPGCSKKTEENTTPGKAEGEDCEEDTECKSGTCKAKQCTAPEGDKPKNKLRRVWLGVTGTLDFIALGSADDVCKLTSAALPLNSAGYYCSNSDGSDFPGRPPANTSAENDSIQIGKSDQVKGGLALGNIRVGISFDYAFTANFMLGARLAYVVGTFPGAAAQTDGKTLGIPLHAELRGTYLFGQDALNKPGISPFVFLGAGIGEFDAHVDVTVIEKGNPTAKTVQAWGIGGPGFVSVGAGGRYAFSPRAGLLFGGKFTGAFGGTFLPAFSPELGLQYGF